MDVRIVKTKNSIINAFLELRSQKNIEKITVKELCEKAMINKSTFYSHFTDLYALSEYLEMQVANEVLEEIGNPEFLFSNPEEFNKQLLYAYLSHENLIETLFSGSRSDYFLVRIENSLKEAVFGIRPDYKEDAVANIVLTYAICGGFYAFRKCRSFGEEALIEVIALLNKKATELLEEQKQTGTGRRKPV